MRILIVDDDDIATEILEHALAKFGYEVTVAYNGFEALDLLRSGQFRLVISDWVMPKMSGLQLCREIRRRSVGGYVYVILLTSRRGTQCVVDGMNAGADDFINKPFEVQELIVRIRAGERLLALESRELIIFSMAKLADRATRRLARTWSGYGNIAACSPSTFRNKSNSAIGSTASSSR